ncbi:MAG: cytochrome c oxidase subunit 3 family protein [Methylotenera sp.]|uniref:cytochrome c oxidase subunit 3 family protein n=1 Tax=Methylotenera sp. TaxID=2051956 RepID=UPI0024896068|nr:cytochrome c oxidase subunit 3 family protein [Methylotenera sp.]MDI1310183.1 cytochrome c oxidase subunit 3 family protein [Methylotenera sp.]
MPPAININNQDDLPGDFAIWIFIFAEMLAFGVLFVAYAFSRAQDVELFNASQLTLSRISGAINTLVLITSSYFVVQGVAAIKRGLNKQCAHWLTGAFILGGVFVVIKMVEFHAKFAADITMSTNNFYMFYLSLTFFHFMHVLMGMVILAMIIMKAKRGGYSTQDYVGVETGASFWHMVDFLWIILFPLVYIIR